MNLRFVIPIGLLILQLLAACTFGNDTSNPTVVPLDETETGPTPTRVVKVQNVPSPTPIPPPSPTPTPTPLLLLPSLFTPTPAPTAATPLAEVIVVGLNLRQGPGVNYPVIGSAYAGDKFKVIGLDPSGEWLQVVVENSDAAWVSAGSTYVRLLGVTLNELPFVEPPPLVAGLSEPIPASVINPAKKGNGLAGKLVFTTSSGGELYVVNADGTGLRRLAVGVIDPVLSPNGQQVAFVRWDGADIGTLFTMNLDDSAERAILGDILQPKSPTWSPDGQSIILAFQHGGLRKPEEICKQYDFDDGVRLPDDIGEITKFRVSGDGISICYIRKEDLKWGLRQVDVATGQFEDLPADPYSFNPAWDPQNPWRLIYDGEKGLIQLDVTNNTNWPLTTDRRDTGPVFSPDGKKLALTYNQHDHWEVYTLNLETGERQRLTKPPILADPQYNSAAPAWSPDGTYLAFLTDRTGRWEIWVMAADGSDQRPLLPPEIQTRLNLDYHGVNERMLNWTE
jgi:TolB protein